MSGQWHSSENTVRFGFLAHDNPIHFEGGCIEPLETYPTAAEHIETYRHRDGYLYPPSQQTWNTNPKTGEKLAKVPNTQKPARVFPPPLSHHLILKSPFAKGDLRRGDAGLIVHLIAVLFETRLQFEGWKFDGKVRIKDEPSILLNKGALSDALSYIYSQWCSWDANVQARVVNILYMHGRAKSCEWEWYRFLTQYLVFDSIYKLAMELKLVSRNLKHSMRLVRLCEKFEIPYDSDTVERIWELRNELVHEASIDGRAPGTIPDDTFYMSKWLERLNARLIFGIGGYQNDFVRSGWWFFGWQSFSQKK